MNRSEGIAMNEGRGHNIFRSKWPLIRQLYGYVSRVFIGHRKLQLPSDRLGVFLTWMQGLHGLLGLFSPTTLLMSSRLHLGDHGSPYSTNRDRTVIVKVFSSRPGLAGGA